MSEFNFNEFADVLLVCLKDTVKGLEYLHTNNIVHSNILVSSLHYCNKDKTAIAEGYSNCPIVCKVTDFGLSRSLDAQTQSIYYVTIQSMETAAKLFSPARFSGESVLAYRQFKKAPSATPGEKQLSVYDGRSIVANTATTPLCLDHNMSKHCYCFFVCATLHER